MGLDSLGFLPLLFELLKWCYRGASSAADALKKDGGGGKRKRMTTGLSFLAKICCSCPFAEVAAVGSSSCRGTAGCPRGSCSIFEVDPNISACCKSWVGV